MTGTTIASKTTVGLLLANAAQNPVRITPTGTISVRGGISAQAIRTQAGLVATIANGGLIEAINFNSSTGIDLVSGGRITNGSNSASTARIVAAGYSIRSQAGGALVLKNFGTIQSVGQSGAGVKALGAATITNGANDRTSALISAYSVGVDVLGAAAAVRNFGTILAAGVPPENYVLHGTGVHLAAGGRVTNGSGQASSAMISGGSAGVSIEGAAGTVVNFGTILGARAAYHQGSPSRGVVLTAGGSVTNGSNADRNALIYGHQVGVFTNGGAATVRNLGTISGYSLGAYVGAGGTLINGSINDGAASITSHSTGVKLVESSTLRNFGTVQGVSDFAVLLDGGTVINGDDTHTQAQITGRWGIMGTLGSGTILNLATISATSLLGISVASSGGAITNGSVSDSVALIRAQSYGPAISFRSGSTARVTNYGAIFGMSGIVFDVGASGTVVNSGVIGINNPAGGGDAIRFAEGNDRLVVAPGASFAGAVRGGAGNDTIELASAPDTGFMRGIGAQFAGFETLAVDAVGFWTLQGANSIPTVVNQWLLRLALNASLTVTSAIDPASTGTFELLGGSTLDVAADVGSAHVIKFNDTARLVVDHAASFGTGIGQPGYTGPLLRNFGPAAAVDMKDLIPGSLVLDYSPATGLLQMTQGGVGVGTLRFETSTLGAGAFHIGNDGSGHALITHS